MALAERRDGSDKVVKKDINLRAPLPNLIAAKRLANRRGWSLNAWICDAIADKLEASGEEIIPFRKPPTIP
jgi:predicted HicB family RNase H-like nuclease